MSTASSFRNKETKHDLYRGKDCTKKVCEFLREHTTKIINLKKSKLSTKEQQKSCENAKICYIYKRKLENKYFKDKKYLKA